MKSIWKRLTSPVTIAGITATLTIIATVANINLQEIVSWGILWENIIAIISNPYVIFSIAFQIFAYVNNPTDRKSF